MKADSLLRLVNRGQAALLCGVKRGSEQEPRSHNEKINPPEQAAEDSFPKFSRKVSHLKPIRITRLHELSVCQ